MVKWLKYLGLSFFSHKQAKRSANYGFGSILTSIILSLLFFYLSYFGGGVAPFDFHYAHSTDYKDFLHNAFTVNDLQININNGSAECERVINTYTHDRDYAKNGYNLIVDTRSSDMLIKFSQVAIRDDTEISYEDYLSLNADARKNYVLKTIYTDEEFIVTEPLLQSYKDYLEERSDETFENYDSELAADYNKLKDNSADYTEDDYGKQIYKLYVKYYYTDVKSGYYGEQAPVLRDYYYFSEFFTEKYFYVFDNIIAGSFETDGGLRFDFGGYSSRLKNGAITDIDDFVCSVMHSAAGDYYFMNFIASAIWLYLLWIVLAPLFIALLTWIIGKFVKDGWDNRFSVCYRTINSFVWFSSLVAAFMGFIGCWLFEAKIMYVCSVVLFTVILVVRTAVYFITETIRNKKTETMNTENGKNDYDN